jgi:hypothetical protein
LEELLTGEWVARFAFVVLDQGGEERVVIEGH